MKKVRPSLSGGVATTVISLLLHRHSSLPCSLHIDLHNPAIREDCRVTFFIFIQMRLGICEGGDFSDEMLAEILRSNDCTILCGKTGSGKSTQVPQFLFEAGFATLSWWRVQQRQRSGSMNASNDDGRCSYNNDDGGELSVRSTPLLIGITQPQCVTAVSTAKRLCFEMGGGNRQSCVTTQEKSDNGVNVELKKKLTLLENYECLG